MTFLVEQATATALVASLKEHFSSAEVTNQYILPRVEFLAADAARLSKGSPLPGVPGVPRVPGVTLVEDIETHEQFVKRAQGGRERVALLKKAHPLFQAPDQKTIYSIQKISISDVKVSKTIRVLDAIKAFEADIKAICATNKPQHNTKELLGLLTIRFLRTNLSLLSDRYVQKSVSTFSQNQGPESKAWDKSFSLSQAQGFDKLNSLLNDPLFILNELPNVVTIDDTFLQQALTSPQTSEQRQLVELLRDNAIQLEPSSEGNAFILQQYLDERTLQNENIILQYDAHFGLVLQKNSFSLVQEPKEIKAHTDLPALTDEADSLLERIIEEGKLVLAAEQYSSSYNLN